MGDQNVSAVRDGQGAQPFTRQLLRDLRALALMLERGLFETAVHRIGAEQELFLVDAAGRPAPLAMEVLERAGDGRLTTELARFNLEANLEPLGFEGDCFSHLQRNIEEVVALVREAAAPLGAQPLLTGILPTLRLADLTLANMTPRERYYALNEHLTRLRGGPYTLYIRGLDELYATHDSVMMEACNTSFQVHLQVSPERFAPVYNIAQVAAAPLLAAAVNAPLLFGKRLWRETRIAVFQQSIDTRSGPRDEREASPRVFFGTRWVGHSVLDIYREDIARFPSVLGVTVEEDPLQLLERGEVPRLRALRIHNSTVYRWNRACYGITDGRPHLRIENRVLPAGPTPIDEVANAAFWLGLVQGLADRYEDITPHIRFEEAKFNFLSAARMGLEAQLRWLDGALLPAGKLILDRLIPIAHDGLRKRNVSQRDADQYLGIIDQRVGSGQTGAQWQLRTLDRLRGEATPARHVQELTRVYLAHQQSGYPVHTWADSSKSEEPSNPAPGLRVEQYMTTDLFTVDEGADIDLAASVMGWRHIRHILVEDERQHLVGIVSLRDLLALYATEGGTTERVAVDAVMTRDPVTIAPEASLREALGQMRAHKIGALPVVRDGRLVGILTERDFIDVAARYL